MVEPPSPAAPRRLLVAGNWKMNGDRALARTLAEEAVSASRRAPDVDVALFPPFTLLDRVAAVLGTSRVSLGGQGCHAAADGAHTSGISARMLVEAGCTTVLCGHSEVRAEMRLDDAGVRAMLAAALAAGLRPLLCVGETRVERERGDARRVVAGQVTAALEGLEGGAGRLDVAYEPVWAIGSGLSASPAQAAEMHALIRGLLDAAGGERARILYGGSVTPDNIDGFLSAPGVDGALVGGRSLDPAAFASLVEAARRADARRRP